MRPTKPFDQASESTKVWWRYPGILYLLGVGDPIVAIKIGMLAITAKTDRRSALARRLASIQSGNHELVQVLGVIVREDGPHPTKDTEDHERELHLEFESFARFKLGTRGGEWFDATPELMDRIKQISVPPAEAGIPATVGSRVQSPGARDA
jgi:hypothetical protein